MSSMSSSNQYTPLFETTTFPSSDGLGIDIILPLWMDNDIGRECVQCDMCHKFFSVNEKRYPITLAKHRNNATCRKAKGIYERKQVIASTTAVANFVAETLFHPKGNDEIGPGIGGASYTLYILVPGTVYKVCLFKLQFCQLDQLPRHLQFPQQSMLR
jgi:hypothetical protein